MDGQRDQRISIEMGYRAYAFAVAR